MLRQGLAAEVKGPLVSVGLPVYNGEDFVAEAIRSIQAQVDVDFELIISDNGSTDSTEKICRRIIQGDDRIKFVRTDVNRGAAWNFNHVVHLARGTYFKWAAHDDVLAPTYLSACVDVLQQNPSVALCYSRVVDVDESGREVMQHQPLVYANEKTPAARGRAILRNPSPCVECFGLVRREQLLRTGMIGAYSASDRTFLFEMALQGLFHEIPDVLFFHRQHAGRSVHKYSGARAREAWFDPSRANLITLSRWRLLIEHVRAVRRAPIGARDKASSILPIGPWAGDMAAALTRELAAWAWHTSKGRLSFLRTPSFR